MWQKQSSTGFIVELVTLGYTSKGNMPSTSCSASTSVHLLLQHADNRQVQVCTRTPAQPLGCEVATAFAVS